MKKIEKSVAVKYSAQEMYDLVIDVEAYPLFLPWCNYAKVLEQYDDGLLAALGLSIGGIEKTFTTRTRHVLGKSVDIELVSGPFSHLQCQWKFLDIPPAVGSKGASHHSRVVFNASYAFSNKLLALAVGLIFDRIMDTFVDAFIQRANSVYRCA